MIKTLLETVNLKKTFIHKNGSIELFDNVNLKVKQGDLIALIGPSGSGKSSFLHLLALLDFPSKGKIILKDNDTKITHTEIKESSNMTSQDLNFLKKQSDEEFRALSA